MPLPAEFEKKLWAAPELRRAHSTLLPAETSTLVLAIRACVPPGLRNLRREGLDIR